MPVFPSVDLTISLGNILTIVSFLIGGIVFIMQLKNMIGIVELRLTALEKSNENQNLEIKKLADILVTLGKYEERFLRIEDRINELRHGKGFIHD